VIAPNAQLRLMAEWPPHAISEDERAAVLAGAEALEAADRQAFELRVARELLDDVGMGHLFADAVEQWGVVTDRKAKP
jgi:hypothetical protein